MCNAIYNHNRTRKSDLALEKHWETQSENFRLATTVALVFFLFRYSLRGTKAYSLWDGVVPNPSIGYDYLETLSLFFKILCIPFRDGYGPFLSPPFT